MDTTKLIILSTVLDIIIFAERVKDAIRNIPQFLLVPDGVVVDRRKENNAVITERRLNNFHWLGHATYPERHKYTITVFGFKIYLWVSVDTSPTS